MCTSILNVLRTYANQDIVESGTVLEGQKTRKRMGRFLSMGPMVGSIKEIWGRRAPQRQAQEAGKRTVTSALSTRQHTKTIASNINSERPVGIAQCLIFCFMHPWRQPAFGLVSMNSNFTYSKSGWFSSCYFPRWGRMVMHSRERLSLTVTGGHNEGGRELMALNGSYARATGLPVD